MQGPSPVGSPRSASPVQQQGGGAAAVEKTAAPLQSTHEVGKPAAGGGVRGVITLERSPGSGFAAEFSERADAATLRGAAVVGGASAADA